MLVKTVLAADLGEPPAQITLVNDLLNNFLTSIIGFAGIVLFVLIIFGGFKYITSGGNPEAAASGRRIITYAIAGLIVIAASYLILVIIKEITGANVTEFNIIFNSF